MKKERNFKKHKFQINWNDVEEFFGKIEKVTDTYFRFQREKSNDYIIIITDNVTKIKGNYVLIIGNDKALYLKEWAVMQVSSFRENFNSYAVKLSRKYFKPYTFKEGFEMKTPFYRDFTFDDFLNVARLQDEKNIAITIGHYDFKKS